MKFFTAFIVLFTFIQINAQIQPKEKFPTASSDSSFFDSFLFDVNKLILPLNNEGVIGDVLIQGEAGGRYDGFGFLYSGGFFLSGKDGDSIWSNAVASASRLQDYLPGKVGESPLDQIFKLYSVRSADPHFGDSWNDWKDAVELGADFYDGDGDGEYNPADLNGNGVWDLNEDAPGIIGDLTAWTVYNDAAPPELRRFNDVEAKGIEIQQTIFANSGSNKQIENIVFIRYRLINTGIVNTVFDSVYFSAWSDPDVGNYQTDLAGSDTLHSSGFIYKDSADALYGINPPAFFKTFLQGPPVYIAGETFIDVNSNGIFDEGIDTPVTNAKNNKGLFLGSEIIPGAQNIGLASVVHYIKRVVQYSLGQALLPLLHQTADEVGYQFAFILRVGRNFSLNNLSFPRHEYSSLLTSVFWPRTWSVPVFGHQHRRYPWSPE